MKLSNDNGVLFLSSLRKISLPTKSVEISKMDSTKKRHVIYINPFLFVISVQSALALS